jgi:hypothetical protein
MHTSNPDWLMASLIALIAAFTLGAVDGLYFHLQRFRLFAHPESRFEHLIHGGRALLMVPALVLLYLVDAGGLVLYAALSVVLADQLLMAVDLWLERRSRVRWGGLPHAEYVIHTIANTLHAVAVVLAFASRPTSAWALAATSRSSSLPRIAQCLVFALAVGAAATAVLHVLLLRVRASSTERRPVEHHHPS